MTTLTTPFETTCKKGVRACTRPECPVCNPQTTTPTLLTREQIYKHLDSFIEHPNVGTIFPETFFLSIKFQMAYLEGENIRLENEIEDFVERQDG